TKEKIPLIGDMTGHPAMAEYIKEGYTIITL
ncbi:MAG: cytoplasmic protein, partial [Candidatus Electrothrix sp. ATG2]|nr:cytoplasmic protein [Candidatus Electrothrix sp. ATG2]